MSVYYCLLFFLVKDILKKLNNLEDPSSGVGNLLSIMCQFIINAFLLITLCAIFFQHCIPKCTCYNFKFILTILISGHTELQTTLRVNSCLPAAMRTEGMMHV